jgi:DNA-binding GntR family transcriptional regulator
MHEPQQNSPGKTVRRSPPKRVSLRDEAYEEIKHRIVNCTLRPGSPVTVSSLAEELGMGRTPVIQAIDRLTVDGLVNVMPRKGVIVAPVSLHDFIEIVEMRLLNEAQAVRWAAEKATGAQISELSKILDETWAAAKSHDVENMIRLDRAFHRQISSAAANSILSDFLGNLHDRSLRFWFISLRAADHDRRVCEQHAAVLEAIGRHDPEKAEEAMRAHIASFHDNATRQILRD